jgi:hypothetical protein
MGSLKNSGGNFKIPTMKRKWKHNLTEPLRYKQEVQKGTFIARSTYIKNFESSNK